MGCLMKCLHDMMVLTRAHLVFLSLEECCLHVYFLNFLDCEHFYSGFYGYFSNLIDNQQTLSHLGRVKKIAWLLKYTTFPKMHK